jgi:6-phospho-beta-glucosidase
VCDTPSGLARRVAALLEHDIDSMHFDYFGLNHLGWLRGVHDEQRELLPDLLADDARLSQLEEARLFGVSCLRELRMVPIEYLAYYYFPEHHLGAVADAGYSRAEFLLRQQQQFYAAATSAPRQSLALWNAARDERDRTYLSDAHTSESARATDADADGYASVAVAVLESVRSNLPSRAIVDIENGAVMPCLPAQATIEVPCTIDARGALASRVVDTVPAHTSTLMQQVYAAEQAALRAARTRSRADAVAALATHPLVAAQARAEQLFGAYLQQQPELASQFA